MITARDLGAIVSRALAVLAAFHGLAALLTLYPLLQIRSLEAGGGTDKFWYAQAGAVGLYAALTWLLWVGARHFHPRDASAHGVGVTALELRSLAVLLLGSYFIIDSIGNVIAGLGTQSISSDNPFARLIAETPRREWGASLVRAMIGAVLVGWSLMKQPAIEQSDGLVEREPIS